MAGWNKSISNRVKFSVDVFLWLLIFFGLINRVGCQNTNPTCTSYAISHAFDETTPVTTALLTVPCSDADAPPDGTLTFTIISGDDFGHFSIDNAGALQLVTAVDYDDFISPHSFQLTIQVTDGGSPPLSAVSDVIVDLIVNPVNDIDPIFDLTPYTTTLTENRAFGSFVYAPTPLELDVIDDLLNFQSYVCSKVEAPPDSDKITVDPVTCVITSKESLDYEVATSHTITIQAVDTGFIPARTAQTTLVITVDDENDNKPICTASAYATEVVESSAVGDLIITLTCTDGDSGGNGQITYSIVSGNGDGYFSVTTTGANGINGEIRLATAFDYDAPLATSSFSITVRASDGGTPVMTSDVLLNIIFIGENDQDPAFVDSTPFATSLPENTDTVITGTGVVFETAISDADVIDPSGTLQTVSCSIAAGDTTMFHIETTATPSCKVMLLQSMDYETATSHVITIKLYDVGLLPVRTTQTTLTVTVTDVNDNAPVCTPDTYTLTISEDTTATTTLQDFSGTCSDVETIAASLTYSITSGDTTKFQITGTALELKSPIDIETEADQWSLEITVSDALPTAYPAPTKITVTVLLTGVDDNVPVWHVDNAGVYTASILENSAVATPVVTITATDADTAGTSDSKITYGIDTATSLFGIDADSGAVFVLSPTIDRETASTHVLTISAYSSNLLASKITGTLTITVTDKNDVMPAFSRDVYTVVLAEDHTVGAVTLSPAISATDTDDAGANSQITYVLTGGHTITGCTMTIDASSGVISLTSNLDYETETSCTATVEARDAGSPSLTGTATVLITVSPVNEFTPAFTGAPYTTNIPENTAIGTSIFTAVATDGDSGDDGLIEYTLTSHIVTFDIERTTGIIRLKSVVDSETLNTYTVNIEAIDQSSATKRTSQTTITVSIDDVNEFSPSCVTVTSVTLTPPINVGDVIHSAGCTDNDVGVNGQITYSFVSGNTNSDFSLAANGDIVVAKLLSQFSYNLEIIASDQAGIPKLSTLNVAITVASVPTFDTLPDTVDINEATPIGTVLYNVSGNSATASKKFSFQGGNGDNKFTMNVYTGVVYLLKHLDRETTNSYTITVRITDEISSTSADATLTINILDANDIQPAFGNDFFNISIVENVPPTTEIIDLIATDNDLGLNSALTYSIVAGDPGNVFSVSAAGKLVLNSALDMETTPSYTLLVTATDGGTPALTGTTLCYVTISDFDEFPTEFLSTSPGGIYSHSLSEGTAIGSKIFNVSARDLDANAQIIYSISAGNDGTFVIEQNNGDIFLSRLLDRETTASYSLTIQARNGLGDSTTATLNIQITDENDNQPQFTPSVGSFNVDENEALGAMITTITCNDADGGVNADLIYTITAGNIGNAFRLDGAVLEVNSALDFGTTSQFIIVIEAKDQGLPARSASTSIIIDVNAIYPLPSFVIGSDTLTIPENTALGTIVYDCDATTAGAIEGTPAMSADLEYMIQSGNTDGKFSIDAYSGEILVVGLIDRDTTASYSLLIKAVNRNDVSKTDYLTLTINLSDVNDIAPIFGSTEYVFSVDETASIASAVGTIVATDNDEGINSVVTYSITAGANMAHFSLDAATGVVKTNSLLDASIQDLYFLTISAVDGGSPPMTGTCKVRINVYDINNQPPSFGQPLYTLSLNELTAVNSVVFPFRATDGDTGPNSILTYSINSGNGDFRFQVNPLTGDLTLAGILDRETVDNYLLVIHATDSGLPINTGTTSLTIVIVDANDNDPIITSAPFISSTISRTLTSGSSVTTVTATDADMGDNGAVEFFIIDGNTDSLFSIDTVTGEIKTFGDLAPASNTYDLVIHAIDKGSNRRTSTATVHVVVDPPITAVTNDYSFTVLEDAIIGTSIGTVAPDPIHAPGATIHFTILSGDTNNDFIIVLNNGLIQTNKLLEHSVKPEYYLTIHLEDQGNPTINYNKAVHITVTDVNNHNPVFNVPTSTLSVVENSPIGLSLYTMTADDADSGTFGTVSYEIDPTNTIATSYVSVDGNGGLSLIASPDYEVITSFSFFLFAKDGGIPSLTGTGTININIIDVNDVDPSAPATSSHYFSFECPTDAIQNDVITTLSPLDFGIASSPTDTIQYITMNSNGVFDFKSPSGDFYVRNRNSLYDQTRYIMWVVLRVQSVTAVANGTSAMIRVDSLTPNQHLVVLKHDVTVDILEAQRNRLRNSLQALFPSNRVGIWKIRDLNQARRRRLLATAQSESVIYVVESLQADTIDGIDNEKTFMTQSEIIQVLGDSNGSPSTALSSAAFTTFPVTSVEPYVDTRTSSSQNWAQTTTGIAVISTIASSLLVLAIILILYFYCTRNSDTEYSFDEEKEENYIKNNVQPPTMYKANPAKAIERQPEMRTSTPVFSSIPYTPPDLTLSDHTPPRKNKQSMVVSMMTKKVPINEVPPALFQNGKYVKENPVADTREGSITPRQILIETKKPGSGKSHSSF